MMNWLLVQFQISALFPLGFIVLGVYALRRPPGAHGLLRWWVTSLFLLAAWGTRQLTPYLGQEIPDLLINSWRAVAHYPLVMAGSFLLPATVAAIGRPLPRPVLYLAGPLLTALALAIDPALWDIEIPGLVLGGLTFGHFELWAMVWAAAWFVPLGIAWQSADRAMRAAAVSMVRNRTTFWQIVVSLLLLGGGLALLREAQVAQQGGAVLLLTGAFLGTLAMARSDLPDLPSTLRRVLYHFGGGVIVFGLATLALLGLALFITNSAGGTTNIVIAAALLTVGLLALVAGVNRLARRLVFGRGRQADQLLLRGPMLGVGRGPAALAEEMVVEVEARYGAHQAWIGLVEEGAGGALIVRPVAGRETPPPAGLAAGSALAHHLLRDGRPLTRDDLAADGRAAGGVETMDAWQAALLLPLRAGIRPVGVLALGHREGGERYRQEEIEALVPLGHYFGLHLALATAVSGVQRAAAAALAAGQDDRPELRRLQELARLFDAFNNLHNPAHLRQPLLDLAGDLAAFEGEMALLETAGDGAAAARLADIRTKLQEAQARIDNLIAVAALIDRQITFDWRPVLIDQVLQAAAGGLEEMAAGRGGQIAINVHGRLLPVWGDGERLAEALRQLLHNALKFNRLDGIVTVDCRIEAGEVCIDVRDEGVGIPEERLADIWRGLELPEGRDDLAGRRRTRFGLPLARFIIRAHGGRIEVESRYGQGSTFRVTLPVLID